MTNRVALSIAFVLICIFAADAYYFEWGLPAILGKLLARLSDWLAFWHDI
ncbi:MAG: hypothetical protein V3V13_06275 [Paracoccaceae bacterium]